MTTPSDPVPHHTSPLPDEEHRVSLHSPEFAADPHRAYREMRARYGPLVPVELAPGVPATLVVSYRTALRILNDPDRFPSDPRMWEKDIPSDCPVLPVLQWRPNAPRNSGADHARYREANATALGSVDLHALHHTVEQAAVPLINTFCTDGSADLVSQYAAPLTFNVINAMLGCPPEISKKAAAATAAIFDGVDAEEGNRLFGEAVLELVRSKQDDPGDDITTRLLQHPAQFDELEMLHQVLSLYGVGMGPLQSLIINTLRLILTDERFGANVLGGALSPRDALDEVLFEDPPLPNASVTYPRQPILIDGAWLPAHQPVVVSLAGCNNDPEISTGDHFGNRAHLSWGAGPHVCPAQPAAYLIVQDAIDQLLDALPELRLAVSPEELIWRPGPLHRTLTELPVTFPASPPLPLL
ncbi:cytochrome [Nocardia donostiensis]|uniref:Cytochrome n=1 Tax=Nocardia donostiensis TaxID=1538463 RepID=A0A1V2TI97_9NOCA|nr:cytochrome [Nocardia donostiensis]OQS14728.1 cytochrome [Nocardia donostiensis]OQS17916.1 cytochrome [Nocardia donostiensis]